MEKSINISNLYFGFHCRVALDADTALLDSILVTLHRESKKEKIEYRRNALKAYAMTLHELDVDRFTEIYDIVQEILVKVNCNYYTKITEK